LTVSRCRKLLFFKTTWGVFDAAGGPFPLSEAPAVLRRIKAMGYDGVEVDVSTAMRIGMPRWQAVLEEAGLLWIAMVFSCGLAPTPGNLGLKSEVGLEHPADNADAPHDVERHKAVWGGQVLEALRLRPVLHAITSHTGKDYFTASEAHAMLEHCLAFEAEHCAPHGVCVNHETHRGRILYTPWTTPDFCARHPAMTLCADLSHFCVVAEAECTQAELSRVVAEITPRVRHVHARVGFPEGPQVPDPRGPGFTRYMEGHMAWWAAIFDAAAAAGLPTISCTPEFGPKDYVPQSGAGEPVANIWEINHWVGLQVQAAYRARFGEADQGRLVPDAEALPPKV